MREAQREAENGAGAQWFPGQEDGPHMQVTRKGVQGDYDEGVGDVGVGAFKSISWMLHAEPWEAREIALAF